MWFGVAPRMGTRKTLVKKDWIACSKYSFGKMNSHKYKLSFMIL